MTQALKNLRRDGAQTQEKLLKAAAKLFDQYGFAGATSKDICQKAGTDVAAINYHFGSRANLYQTILQTGHEYFISVKFLQKLQKADLTAEQKLHSFFSEIVRNLHQKNSLSARIFAREVLTPTPDFADLIAAIVQPKFQILRQIVADILDLKITDKQNDALLLRCVANVIAPCLMILVTGNNAAMPTHSLLKQKQEDLVEHMYQFALAGLKIVSKSNLKA